MARAIAEGAKTVEDVAGCTRAGTGCGSCVATIQQALDMAHGRAPQPLIVLRTGLAAIVT